MKIKSRLEPRVWLWQSNAVEEAVKGGRRRIGTHVSWIKNGRVASMMQQCQATHWASRGLLAPLKAVNFKIIDYLNVGDMKLGISNILYVREKTVVKSARNATLRK